MINEKEWDQVSIQEVQNFAANVRIIEDVDLFTAMNTNTNTAQDMATDTALHLHLPVPTSLWVFIEIKSIKKWSRDVYDQNNYKSICSCSTCCKAPWL